MNDIPQWAWLGFIATLFILLAVDLFSHRGAHSRSRRQDILWSAVWISVGLGFSFFVWALMGGDAAQEYLAAYLIEESLSLDNLFVFLLIFQTLQIPLENQRRALLWGIFGALVFRGLFIFLGVAAMERWEWITYLFGALLFFAAWRALREPQEEVVENQLVNWLGRHLPVSNDRTTPHLFTRENGKLLITPLLVAIIGLELSDILFAIDSVPAALSVTRREFLVYSSNAFAILGLRSLYVVLVASLEKVRYLNYGLAAVLTFAGFKLVTHDFYQVPPMLSVGIIAAILLTTIVVSLWLAPEGRKPRSNGQET
ncbi:MAG TPA: TerC/Alx family metal homeostasis membrane protein [Woeseiaceae bacterium]|nr:TerC/Alx family metal homeostasis membrane protein [Woeseiaceae bacterium]